MLSPFNVTVPNLFDSVSIANSANNDFASGLVIDISHSKARFAEEYWFYPKCVHYADAKAYLFAN